MDQDIRQQIAEALGADMTPRTQVAGTGTGALPSCFDVIGIIDGPQLELPDDFDSFAGPYITDRVRTLVCRTGCRAFWRGALVERNSRQRLNSVAQHIQA